MTTGGQIILPYGDPPDTPPAGKVAIYTKSDEFVYYKTDDGVEHPITNASGVGVSDHGQLLGLLGDDHTNYHTDDRGDTRYYTQDQINTISGALHTELGSANGVDSFIDLVDTPDSYIEGQHIITNSSGIEFGSHFIGYVLYVSPLYEGNFSDGSYDHPFKTLYDLAMFSYTTYTGINDAVTIRCMPGTYYFDDTMLTANTSTKAIIGSDPTTTIFKPTINILGKPMVGTTVPVSFRNISLDATDIPAMKTTPGTIGYKATEGDFNEVVLDNCNVRGFYNNVVIDEGSNVYAKFLDLSDSYINLTVSSGSLFDADMCYIYDSEMAHVHAIGDSEVYFAGCELYSWNYEPETGTAVIAEEDSYVELFGGTNIWGCDKNIIVKDDATVKVDNSVLEFTRTLPGIEQRNNSNLIIINSRAPLSYEDIYVETPENVYINSFDSTDGETTMGTGADADINLFSISTGSLAKPHLKYQHDRDGYKALVFKNESDGQKTILAVEGNNEETELGVKVVGTNAFNHDAMVTTLSEQDGIIKGWEFGKEAGTSPAMIFKYSDGKVPLHLNTDGTITLNSGISVNNILDEDTLISNDAKSLITQRSAKSFVENTTYSQTALDNGQLDDRYFTKSQVSTLSGTLIDTVVKKDGSTELTSDWNAGDYEITSAGFIKDETQVDLASYANITGVLGGGILSINSEDNTIVSVTSGTSVFVDMSDRSNPVVEKLSWASQDVPATISGFRSKWAGVNRVSEGVGSIVVDNFSQLEKRSIALLGRIWGNGNAEITGIGNYKTAAFSFGKSMEDLAYTFGSINISGNEFMPSESAMTLDKYSGESLRFSAGYATSETSPNIIQSPSAISLSTYNYHIQGSNTTVVETTIQPNYYDLAGVKIPVPSGKWTCQRVYYFPGSSTVHIVYGQYYYDSHSLAYDSILNTYPVLNKEVLMGSILMAYIVVQEGCTDLNDVLKASVVIAIGIDGVVPGVSNHGEMGGLQDDDHLQYHNDLRGDTRYYTQSQVDNLITTVSGGSTISGTLTHGNLLGLSSDDHLQYSRVDGTRDFSSAVSYSAGITFSGSNNLISKGYVDNLAANFSIDHGNLTGRLDDDHIQYTLVAGTRPFTGKQSYISHPAFIVDTELVDKKYVDDEINNLTTDHGSLEGLMDDDHTQYHNDVRGDIRYYTRAQLGTLMSSHFAATSTDHDGRYYTEDEVDSFIGTLALDVQTTFDSIATGELPSCQMRRSTSLTLPATWEDILFDVTDIENSNTILEHSSVDTERLLIKESGLYLISYVMYVYTTSSNTCYSRVIKNGTTVLDGGDGEILVYSGEKHSVGQSFIANLQENDYITIQSYFTLTNTATVDPSAAVSVVSLKGMKGEDGLPGEDGATGSGSNIIVKDAGTNVINTPHSAINFIGDSVTVSDSGSGVVEVEVTTPEAMLFGTQFAWAEDSTTSSTNSTTYQEKLSLDVTGVPTGYYRIGWYFEWNNNSDRDDIRARIVSDNTTVEMELNIEPKDKSSWQSESGFVIKQLTSGNHFFDIDYSSENTGVSASISRARLEFWRVS